jgi:hypothetical protein
LAVLILTDLWYWVRQKLKLQASREYDQAISDLASSAVAYAEEKAAAHFTRTLIKVPSQQKLDMATEFVMNNAKHLRIPKMTLDLAKNRVTAALSMAFRVIGAAAKNVKI